MLARVGTTVHGSIVMYVQTYIAPDPYTPAMLLEPPPESAGRPHRARRRRGNSRFTSADVLDRKRDYRRVVIYLRISRDKTGDEHGVDAQEQRALAICAARGWDIVAIYKENDRSAADPDAHRPKFKNVLRHVQNDECDVVLAIHWDRLLRQNRESLDFMEICRDERVLIHLINGGDKEVWTPTGELEASILTAVAVNEVRQKSYRQQDNNKARARNGLPPAGGPRAFGFTKDGMANVPEEAKALKWGYKHILGGGSVREVTREWERIGVKTARTNGGMNDRAVNVILRNPRNAGIRCYYDEEQAAAGVWPAIIDQDTYRKALAILDDPARRTTPGPTRKHLLSGIILCGKCAAEDVVRTCRVIPASSKGRKWRTYGCTRDRRSGAHLARKSDLVEELVIHEVLDYLARKACDEMLHRQGPDIEGLKAERVKVREERAGLVAAINNGVVTMGEVQVRMMTLKERLAELDAQITDQSVDPAIASVVSSVLAVGDDQIQRLDAAMTVWEDYTLSQRRSLIESLVTITLHPATKRGKFDSSEVTFEWKR